MKKIYRRFVHFFNRVRDSFSVLLGNFYLYSKRKYAFHRLSFSQEGEDLLIERIFPDQSSGFFVDVGAHHPSRFSNTYLLYLKGWRGVNIDANPEAKILFDKLRPEDKNVLAAISSEEKSLTYHMFDEPALNTCDSAVARIHAKNSLKLAEQVVPGITLKSVLDGLASEDNSIDLLTVDVEGLDLAVLKSNDWFAYRPKVVFVESYIERNLSIEDLLDSPLVVFMKSVDYQFFSRLDNTLVFKQT